MRSIFSKRLASVVAVTAMSVGAMVGAAPLASAVQPGTYYFSNEAQCRAAIPAYTGSFTRLVQGCTYAGSYFGPFKTSDGPYFFVVASRTS